MPDLGPFHAVFVFAHVLGVFLFLLAHGISAGVMLRLRSERDPAAVRTLVDLSRRTMVMMSVGALIWFVAGVVAGFSGNYWTTGSYWIWASLAIAIAATLVMTPMGRFYFSRIREAVGVDLRSGAVDPAFSFEPDRLEAAIGSGRPVLLTAIGIGSVVVLTWLMVFKPF